MCSLIPHHKGPCRLTTRTTGLTTILSVGLCSIFYLALFLPGFSVRSSLDRWMPKTSSTSEPISHHANPPRRLIVFGDSWSDNGQYPIDPPLKDQSPAREEAQGKAWTEWLCTAISCTHHDNFARSLLLSWESGYSGPVVDSDLLNTTLTNTTSPNSTLAMNFEIAEPLADLKTQVQQWLQFERNQYGNGRISELERNGTVFTLWFSLWDLWYYSEKTFGEAEVAVTKSMDSLFDQLDEIAQNWPSKLKIVMPAAIDATFLPGWHSIRTGPRGSDPRGESQRNAVLLTEHWNRALDMRATRWDQGSMFIYNTNEWLLEQVRTHQLFTAQLSDANGMGATESPWSNVRSGCVERNKILAEALGVKRCIDSNAYLFWDDMHLGPQAMKMIGEGVAQEIASNRRDSWFAHETEMTKGEEDAPEAFVAKDLP